jgi:hypothetical protein
MLEASAFRWEPSAQVTPEQRLSQQVSALFPAIVAEFDFNCLFGPHDTSELLAVLPLHLPVTSASQQTPPDAVSVPTMLEASAFRWEPSAQVTPEQTLSQQVSTAFPAILAEFDFSCLFAPHDTSELAVLPLHLPATSASQQTPPEAVSVPTMLEAPVFRWEPSAQVTPEQTLSQHSHTERPVILAESDFSFLWAPHDTEKPSVLPLHLPTTTASQQAPPGLVSVPSPAMSMVAAVVLRTPPASHETPEHLALQQSICFSGALMDPEFVLSFFAAATIDIFGGE